MQRIAGNFASMYRDMCAYTPHENVANGDGTGSYFGTFVCVTLCLVVNKCASENECFVCSLSLGPWEHAFNS